MKKVISIFLIICCFLLALSGCSTATKYKRISFDSDTLGEEVEQYIDESTEVVNTADESFSGQFPVYKISERKISEKEFQTMLKQLEIGEIASRDIELKENIINGTIKSVTDYSAGEFHLTDEELEKLAWETFNKLPFMEGTYTYDGITKNYTISSDATGTIITRVGVSFRRVIDDIRILGSEQCDLYFDNTGLVEIFIKRYNYERISTMNLLSLSSAFSRIKNPDSFRIYTEPSEPKLGMLDTLRVEQCELVFYNQYYRGCTILQPVYDFIGTATDADGKQEKFKAKIIAIPDSHTYESE